MTLTIQETDRDIYWVIVEGGGTSGSGEYSYHRAPMTKQGTFGEAYNFAIAYLGDGCTEIRLDKRLCIG